MYVLFCPVFQLGASDCDSIERGESRVEAQPPVGTSSLLHGRDRFFESFSQLASFRFSNSPSARVKDPKYSPLKYSETFARKLRL